VKLAVITISLLAASLGYATFYESWYGTAAVQEGIYKSKGFQILMLFLAANILCAALIRFPWKKRQTGFVITHVGLLVLIFGSWWTLEHAEEGQVGLLEGTTASTLIKTDFPVIRLKTIDPKTGQADREYEIPFRPGPFAWKPGRYEVISQPSDPFKLAVKAFYPASMADQIVVPDPLGTPSLKLRPRIKAPGAVAFTDAFEDEHDRWFHLEPSDTRFFRASRQQGPAQFSFQYVDKPEMVEDFLKPPRAEGPQGAVRFRYQDKDGKPRTFDWPVVAKADAPAIALPDSDLAARFTGLENIPSGPTLAAIVGPTDIPVVTFKIRRGTGPEVDHYALGNLPMMPNTIPARGTADGKAPDPLVSISYLAPPVLDIQAMRLGVIEVVATPEQKLYYRVFGRREGGGTEIRSSGPLAIGQEIQALGGDRMPMQLSFQVEDYVPKGADKLIYKPYQLPKSQMGTGIPAALVELTVDGKAEDVWVSMSADQFVQRFEPVTLPSGRFELAYDSERKPFGFEIALDDFDVGFDPGTEQASSFTSQIRLTDEVRGVKEKPVTISMNEPMKHRQYTFYQSSYIPVIDPQTRQKTGEFKSVFQVGSDPGREIKYAGSLLVVLGTFIQFYMRAGVTTLFRKGGASGKAATTSTEVDEPL